MNAKDFPFMENFYYTSKSNLGEMKRKQTDERYVRMELQSDTKKSEKIRMREKRWVIKGCLWEA